jgi:hypothetical protein
MQRHTHASLDDLLDPVTLGALTGAPVAVVRQQPMAAADSLSGSRLLLIETDGELPGRFVLKRSNRAWDWIMRATDDWAGRAILAWTTGLIDRLPSSIITGYVACARDGDGWAILMHDLSDSLFPAGDVPLAETDHLCLLEAMADLHTRFWEQPALASPALGFCALAQHYLEFAPSVALREAAGPDPSPPLIGAGWRLLPELVAPEVAAIVRPLLEDPQPLVAAMHLGPQTIVHGDWKLGNLGITAEPKRQVALLDWAVVGPGPAGLDLAWYLAVNSARLPVSKEAAIEQYRTALMRRLGQPTAPNWWDAQLDLALLGGFVQLGWPKLLGASDAADAPIRQRERIELDWWSERVVIGGRRLRTMS